MMFVLQSSLNPHTNQILVPNQGKEPNNTRIPQNYVLGGDTIITLSG